MQSLGQIRSAAESVAVRAVRLYRLRATLWAMTLASLVTLAFVLADYTLHLEERGLRWLLSLLWGSSLSLVLWYWVRDGWQFRMTSIEVARWIEQGHPELAGQLSNLLAADQLPPEDLRFGSLELRRAAMAAAPANFSQLSWQGTVDQRPTALAAIACLVIVLSIAAFGVASRSLAALGLQRMVAPWRLAPWPRADQLEFVNLPSMIAINQELEVQVIDRQPPLPVEITLELKPSTADAKPASLVKLPMRLMDQLAVVTLPAVDRDFQLRVLGGDQRESAWKDIRVAKRPALVEHEFTIQPPSYTGQPPLKLVGQRIEVLAGSRATFRGRFDLPVTAVKTLNLAQPNTQLNSQTDFRQSDSAALPAPIQWQSALAADGLSFELTATGGADTVIQHDQQWQLEVTTAEGLVVVDERTWQIRVAADQSPTVIMGSLPSSNITRHAELRINGQATDDLGLTEVALLTQTTDASLPHREIIWQHTAKVGNEDTKPNASPLQRAVEINTTWPRDGQPLTNGQRITLELEAVDSAGQKSKSLMQTVEVLDDQAMLAQLQLKQAEVFSRLREVAQSQERATHWLERTLEVAQATGQLGSAETDALNSALQTENSAADALVRLPDSAGGQLSALHDQLVQNDLGDSQLADDLSHLNAELERMKSETMQPAIEQLEKALQAVRAAASPESLPPNVLAQLNQSLTTARKWSDQLNTLSKSAASVESLAETQKQFQQLLHQQQTVRKQTEELQLNSLRETDRAQLLSQRTGVRSDQQELARNVSDLLTKLDQQLEEQSRSDSGQSPSEAFSDTLQRVREQLLEQQVGGRMQQAAEQVDENELLEALQSQQASIEALEQIVGEFSSSGPGGLEGSSHAMENLSRQLNNLAQVEKKLAEQFRQMDVGSDKAQAKSLAAQQAQLSSAVEQAAANALTAQNLTMRETLQRAHDSASSAAQAADSNQFERAAEQAGETAEQLQAAQQQANQKAEQLREQLSQQQLYDLSSMLAGLVKRQTSVVDSLSAIPQDAESKQLDPLPNLIAEETRSLEQLRENISDTKLPAAFAWLLQQCDEELVRSIAALQRKRVHPEGLTSASAALDMFRAAQAALADPAGDASSADDQTSSDQSSKESDQSKPRAGLSLPSLKLLREMQTLLNDQLTKLATQSPPDTAALQIIADRQQSLADQVEKVINESSATGGTGRAAAQPVLGPKN